MTPDDLKVTRIDSPLGRRGASAAPAAAKPAPRTRRERESGAKSAADNPGQRGRPPEQQRVGPRRSPPSLDEALALMSHRVPESLRVNLSLFTRALRERRGAGSPVSQKTLPEQEILALAIWMLGDPRSADDLERIAEAHDDYRAQQLAAAAAALTNRRAKRST
jgi:hypothetical protein